MPDAKISALTALSAAPDALDIVVIVDVSDTTQAASGTTKKILLSDLMKYIADAELAAFAGLASAADKGVYFTGSGTASLFDLPSQARTFLACTTVPNQIAALSLSPADSPTFASILVTSAVTTALTASGAVKFGTTASPNNSDTVTPTAVLSANGVAASMQMARHTAPGGGGCIFTLSSTRGSDINSYTTVQSGDGIGSVKFSAADGTRYIPGAIIQCNVDGTPATDSMPARMAFGTSLTGANSITSRLTITSVGDLLVGAAARPTANGGNGIWLPHNGATNPTPGAATCGFFGKTVTQTEAFGIDSAGNAVQITGHYDPDLARAAGVIIDDADPYPRVSNEENPYLGIRALTYTSPTTGKMQRVIVPLPPEECWDWEEVQDQHEAAANVTAGEWQRAKEEHSERTAGALEKHNADKAKWDQLDEVGKSFVPAPKLSPLAGEFDQPKPPGFQRMECPKWISERLARSTS